MTIRVVGLFAVVLFIMAVGLTCFAAEEKDGVTYYGNDDLKTYKRSAPTSQQKDRDSTNLNISAADQIKGELTDVLCRKDQQAQDPELYTFEQIDGYIYRLKLIREEIDRAPMQTMQRYYLKQLADSCKNIWSIMRDQKLARINTQRMLQEIYERHQRGR